MLRPRGTWLIQRRLLKFEVLWCMETTRRICCGRERIMAPNSVASPPHAWSGTNKTAEELQQERETWLDSLSPAEVLARTIGQHFSHMEDVWGTAQCGLIAAILLASRGQITRRAVPATLRQAYSKQSERRGNRCFI